MLTRLAGFMLEGNAVSRPKKFVMFAFSVLVRARLVVFDSLAASATETFTVMMSPTRLGRRRRHRKLGKLRRGIADRRELGPAVDLLDAVDRRACRQARDRAEQQNRFQRLHIPVPQLLVTTTGVRRVMLAMRGETVAPMPASALTVPWPVTIAVIWRKETGLSTVTFSPRPPSLIALPVAVSCTPGTSKVMVTVEPLLTRIGWRTSSLRTLSPARSTRRVCMPMSASMLVAVPDITLEGSTKT